MSESAGSLFVSGKLCTPYDAPIEPDDGGNGSLKGGLRARKKTSGVRPAALVGAAWKSSSAILFDDDFWGREMKGSDPIDLIAGTGISLCIRRQWK